MRSNKVAATFWLFCALSACSTHKQLKSPDEPKPTAATVAAHEPHLADEPKSKTKPKTKAKATTVAKADPNSQTDPPALKVSMRGNIYDSAQNPSTPIFFFKRLEKMEGDKRIVEGFFYNADDSKLALYERIVYGPNSPNFESYIFDRPLVNDKATMEIKDGKLHFHYVEFGEVTQAQETLEPNTINRDEVVPFVNKNWELLMQGEKLRSRFIIPDMAETVGFGMRKAEDTTIDGKPATKMNLFALSPFIAMVAGDTYLYFEKEGEHRILRVDGRTPLMKKVGEKFKSLIGRMDFYYDDAKAEPTGDNK